MKLSLMKKVVSGCLAAGMIVLGGASTAFADALDDFRSAVDSRTYMIRYTAEQVLSDEFGAGMNRGRGRESFAGESIQSSLSMGAMHRSCFIVSDGEDFYAEISMFGNPPQYYLKQGDKFFEFQKISDGKKMIYTQFASDQLNVLLPRAFTPLDDGYRNGEPEMKKAMGALFPDATKTAFEKVYHRAGSGTTENGLTYFDLKADENVEASARHLDIIRYYFRGEQLARIEIASYARAEDDVFGGKTIIKVLEYSPVPDRRYLSLPPEVKEGIPKK